MLYHLVLTWYDTISYLLKTQVTYLRLLSHGENTITDIYQLDSETHNIISSDGPAQIQRI